MAEVWTPMAPAASLWADTAEPLPAFPKLAGEVKADVVIIGAGYTGLSAAHHIAKSGLSPVVLEANHPGWGASGRNGGVITAKFRLSFRDIDAAHGRAMARRMYEIAHDFVEMVDELVSEFGIASARLTRSGQVKAAHNQATLQGRDRRSRMDEARDGRYGGSYPRCPSGARRDGIAGLCRRGAQSGFRRHPSAELPARSRQGRRAARRADLPGKPCARTPSRRRRRHRARRPAAACGRGRRSSPPTAIPT